MAATLDQWRRSPDGARRLAPIWRHPQAGANRRFKLTSSNRSSTCHRTYLVRDVLPRRGIGLDLGRAEIGKTFFALDLVRHVALGPGILEASASMQGGVL